jgi:hypothetical protein
VHTLRIINTRYFSLRWDSVLWVGATGRSPSLMGILSTGGSILQKFGGSSTRIASDQNGSAKEKAKVVWASNGSLDENSEFDQPNGCQCTGKSTISLLEERDASDYHQGGDLSINGQESPVAAKIRLI